MPRHIHTAGRRLQESRTLVLVSELWARGARTKTIERLTGLGQLPIRDVYREMYGESPQKGPSGYSHAAYTNTQIAQLDATCADVCINTIFQARDSKAIPPAAPELGYLYCEAYDLYRKTIEPLNNLVEPMCFERFAHLALTLSKGLMLGKKKCIRCDTPFVTASAPASSNQRLCPSCRLTTARNCARCDVYVPLDSLDISPKRQPMCAEHAAIHRPTTYNRRQYLSEESAAESSS